MHESRRAAAGDARPQTTPVILTHIGAEDRAEHVRSDDNLRLRWTEIARMSPTRIDAFLNKFFFTERPEFRTEVTEPNTLSALCAYGLGSVRSVKSVWSS